jgi:aminobenzoyl-glutamate transport protein
MMRLEDDTLTRITPEEMRGLWKAGIAVLICLGGIIVACIPSNSFFRNEGGELLGRSSSPLLDSAIILISVLFFVPGIVYGKTVGSLKGEKEICGALSNAMASMGSFLALAFVAAQFINYFNYTRIGTVVALAGAGIFKKINMGVIPIAIIFIVFSAIMNLFMGSSSAKWNILAPVFVPMFMVLGYSPELCQLVYRIGDSCTNVITPMMSYYAVILAFAQRYDKNAGIGTLTAMMLPYSIIFLVGWTLLLIIWLLLGLPIGVGTSIFIS